MRLIIKGNVKPKKNSKQIMVNRRTGKPFIMTNESATAYIQHAITQLKEQFAGYKVTKYPVSVQLVFYYETQHRRDIDNSASTILDCMKEAGVIEDDDCKHVDELLCTFGGYDKDNPRVEITLVD